MIVLYNYDIIYNNLIYSTIMNWKKFCILAEKKCIVVFLPLK